MNMFSDDAERLVTFSFIASEPDSPQFRVWDTADGRELAALRTLSTIAGLSCIALSPDAKRIALGRRTTLAFSADGERLATVHGTSGDRPAQVVVWDAAGGTERSRRDGPTGRGMSVAFRPDGRLLAAVIGKVGETGRLIVYDLQTGSQRDLGGGHQEVQYTPDGTRLIGPLTTRLQRMGKCQIGLRDAENGRLLLVLKGHSGSSSTIFAEKFFAFTADGHRIVSAAFTEKALEVKRWDAAPLPEPKK